MVYWRIFNIDGFFRYRLNWLYTHTIALMEDNVLAESPIYRALKRRPHVKP
jgi:hypothetical protein